MVTPVPLTVGVALVAVTEYTNPFSVEAGQTPSVVTLPVTVAVDVVIAEDEVVVTACATVAVPVPV